MPDQHHRSERPYARVPYFAPSRRKLLRSKWTTQVWVIVCGHTTLIASGKSGQAVADDHQHVADAAVTDLGQDVQPVLRTLAADVRVSGPQSEDVAATLAGDCECGVDGPVRDLPVASLLSGPHHSLIGVTPMCRTARTV